MISLKYLSQKSCIRPDHFWVLWMCRMYSFIPGGEVKYFDMIVTIGCFWFGKTTLFVHASVRHPNFKKCQNCFNNYTLIVGHYCFNPRGSKSMLVYICILWDTLYLGKVIVNDCWYTYIQHISDQTHTHIHIHLLGNDRQ